MNIEARQACEREKLVKAAESKTSTPKCTDVANTDLAGWRKVVVSEREVVRAVESKTSTPRCTDVAQTNTDLAGVEARRVVVKL